MLFRSAVYSDPGFYIPELGCFSEADYGWVADLGGFQPLCGLRTVFHQYSWTAWDGVASVDGDVFRGSYGQLLALTSTPKPKPTPGQIKTRKHRELAAHYRVRSQLRALITKHHCRTHAKPRSYHTVCGYWLKHGQREARFIKQLHHEGIR